MIPLVIDLDGTLARTDTLAETLLRLLAEKPLALLRLLAYALSGRAAFKRRAAQLLTPNPASLTYNQAVIALAKTAHAEGRPLYLATGADEAIARRIAAHFGFFQNIFASNGTINLTGRAKSARLTQEFGVGGFDYVGDSTIDLKVWPAARRAYLIFPSAALLARAKATCTDVITIGTRPTALARFRLLLRAIRLHQWAKNSLIFVPVIAAHKLHGLVLAQAALAFIAFSFCASSVYVLNDLLDLPHDRAHPTKQNRPFASGALNLALAPALVLLLLAATLAAAITLPPQFAAMLALYYLCTLAYSFALKRRMVADIVMLAGLYTIRIFAGAAATAIPISPWLLAFALFLFFSLAVVKRLTELTLFIRNQANSADAKLSGRGYGPEDLDILRSMATASGYMSVLIMALYVNSSEVLPLYHQPKSLWALCPILLFWVSRVLILANRGQMPDDPVVFALRDRVSLLCGAAAFLTIAIATF